jgi:hypothetical protein
MFYKITALVILKPSHNAGVMLLCKYAKVKVKLFLYSPWRPTGLREVEAPTFSDIELTDGGEVVSPTRRPLLPPERFLVLISVRG